MKRGRRVLFGIVSTAAAALWLSATMDAHATLTWASPLTLDSHGVVGAASGLTGDGQPGGIPNLELTIANELLSLDANASLESGGRTYETGPTDYSGTISGPGSPFENQNHVGSGWEYAIAKYDGQNGGYILFCLNGQDAILPEYSHGIWSNDQQDPGSYQISGFTVFNAVPVPEPSTIVAGALTLLPFGIGALRSMRRGRIQ